MSVAYDSGDYNQCTICQCITFIWFCGESGVGLDHAECAKCGAVFFVGEPLEPGTINAADRI